MQKELLKNKNVLVVGLGVLGGGVSTVKWLVRQGAKTTITDLQTKKQLQQSIKELGTIALKIKFVLGKHNESDFKLNDIIVVNPAVKIEGNRFLKIAKRAGKLIVNDLAFFLEYSKKFVIAITGTHGKTTTTNWIAHFISSKYPKTKAGGNSSDEALLKLLSKMSGNKKRPSVLELSSFQLEIANHIKRSPNIALITNLYQDHLNRHGSMKKYALAKANIFKNQNERQNLIFNKDNEWTPFFLKQNPKAKIFFFSQKPLLKNENGIYIKKNFLYFKNGETEKIIFSAQKLIAFRNNQGEHNLQNLMGSLLASHLFGIPWNTLKKRITSLPSIPYREQIILQKKNLIIVNDSAGTSPDAMTAALKRFSNKNCFVITGGTDKNLDFKYWAKEVKKYIKSNRIYFLNGSATQKMISELKKIKFFKSASPLIFEDLKKILISVKKEVDIQTDTTILFSPASASFEKFKNEFDRGEKFTLYSKQLFFK